MSEDFVDVTWRGLEVVKKARLRCKDARTAYVEHGTPMPTGSQLTIRTADGLEIAAVVARVQEQIGGRTEPPGMELAVETTGAAATWWLGRIEAHARSVRAAARQTLIMTHLPDAVPELAVAPIMTVIDTGPMTAVPAAALAAPPPVVLETPTIPDLPVVAPPAPASAVEPAAPPSAVEPAAPPSAVEPAAPPSAVEPAAPPTPSARTTQPLHTVAPKAVAAAAAKTAGRGGSSVRTTQLMHTVAGPGTAARDRTQHAAPDEATEHLPGAPQPAGEATDPADARDAVPSDIDDSTDGPMEGLVDDGRRTMVMAAIDIAAIVSASADATPSPDDDTSGGNGDKKKAARGKKRRGR